MIKQIQGLQNPGSLFRIGKVITVSATNDTVEVEFQNASFTEAIDQAVSYASRTSNREWVGLLKSTDMPSVGEYIDCFEHRNQWFSSGDAKETSKMQLVRAKAPGTPPAACTPITPPTNCIYEGKLVGYSLQTDMCPDRTTEGADIWLMKSDQCPGDLLHNANYVGFNLGPHTNTGGPSPETRDLYVVKPPAETTPQKTMYLKAGENWWRMAKLDEDSLDVTKHHWVFGDICDCKGVVTGGQVLAKIHHHGWEHPNIYQDDVVRITFDDCDGSPPVDICGTDVSELDSRYVAEDCYDRPIGTVEIQSARSLVVPIGWALMNGASNACLSGGSGIDLDHSMTHDVIFVSYGEPDAEVYGRKKMCLNTEEMRHQHTYDISESHGITEPDCTELASIFADIYSHTGMGTPPPSGALVINRPYLGASACVTGWSYRPHDHSDSDPLLEDTPSLERLRTGFVLLQMFQIVWVLQSFSIVQMTMERHLEHGLVEIFAIKNLVISISSLEMFGCFIESDWIILAIEIKQTGSLTFQVKKISTPMIQLKHTLLRLRFEILQRFRQSLTCGRLKVIRRTRRRFLDLIRIRASMFCLILIYPVLKMERLFCE